jgi:hypothetical protein
MRAILAGAALMLGACASGVPVERQTVVSGRRFDAVQGEAAFLVRTFLPDEQGERREVVGARCAVVSSLYAAELVTPSRLVVPNFGPQSPEITVDCAAGELAGSGTARIVTRWRDPPGYWGYPWGPFYRPYAWDWYGPGYPVSDYPDLAIVMRPDGASAQKSR